MGKRIGFSRRRGGRVAPVTAVVVTFLGGLVFFSGQAVATTVTADIGSSYGVYARVSLFGALQPPFGPVPRVTLPSAGSSTVLSATAKSENVAYGPATFFNSGAMRVTTTGTTGATGSVSSTTSVASAIQAAGTCPGTETACVYAGPFTANSFTGSCHATQTAVSAKASFVNGQLVTATDTNGNPTKTVAIPAAPPANYTVNGFLYANSSDKESFTWIFNQQTLGQNGSLTVLAAHEILRGPTATGYLIVGESICGVTKG